jgi:hypothetical protein
MISIWFFDQEANTKSDQVFATTSLAGQFYRNIFNDKNCAFIELDESVKKDIL